jgi:hypothetical protein
MNEFNIILEKLIEAEIEIKRLKVIINKLSNDKEKIEANVPSSVNDALNNTKLTNKEKVYVILEAIDNVSTSDIMKMTGIHKRTIQRYRKSIGKVYKPIEATQFKKLNTSKTYLMKNSRNNLYKIGRSKNPKQREKTLQSEEPEVKIIKLWDKDIENTLHKDYSKYRVRGEWFKLSKIQVKYICTNY